MLRRAAAGRNRTFRHHRRAGPFAMLAACLLAPGCLGGLGNAADVAPEVVHVASGSVAIGGPSGYCVDPVASRMTGAGAFLLLGSCAALNPPARAAPPSRLAVLTASVASGASSAPLADQIGPLAEALATEAGRAMLSRSGDASRLTLLAATPLRGILFLHLRDDSPFDGAEVDPTYWRAITEVDGRMVVLSVLPLRARPLGDAAARALLDAFIDRVQRENAPPPAAPAGGANPIAAG